MAIDRKPEVGRILVRKSIMRDEYFRAGGPIVRLTSYLIYYRPREGEAYVSRRSVAAVCDTAAEVESLLAFDREMRERRHALLREQQVELKRRFGL